MPPKTTYAPRCAREPARPRSRAARCRCECRCRRRRPLRSPSASSGSSVSSLMSGIAPPRGRRGREHVQPPRRDDGDAERHVTRVDEEHTHGGASTRKRKNREKRTVGLETAGERLAGATEEPADRRAGAFAPLPVDLPADETLRATRHPRVREARRRLGPGSRCRRRGGGRGRLRDPKVIARCAAGTGVSGVRGGADHRRAARDVPPVHRRVLSAWTGGAAPAHAASAQTGIAAPRRTRTARVANAAARAREATGGAGTWLSTNTTNAGVRADTPTATTIVKRARRKGRPREPRVARARRIEQAVHALAQFGARAGRAGNRDRVPRLEPRRDRRARRARAYPRAAAPRARTKSSHAASRSSRMRRPMNQTAGCSASTRRDERLRELRPVVEPREVRVLVHHDRVEAVVVQCEHGWRQQDHRTAEAQRRGRAHVARDAKLREAAAVRPARSTSEGGRRARGSAVSMRPSAAAPRAR